MANVNVNARRVAPVGGASGTSEKMGFIPSTAKVAQNDTITIGDATEVAHCNLVIASTGVVEPFTISGNVITLTSATAGPVSGTIVYR